MTTLVYRSNWSPSWSFQPRTSVQFTVSLSLVWSEYHSDNPLQTTTGDMPIRIWHEMPPKSFSFVFYIAHIQVPSTRCFNILPRNMLIQCLVSSLSTMATFWSLVKQANQVVYLIRSSLSRKVFMTLSKALCIPKGAGRFVMTPVVLQKQHEHVLRLPNKYMVHLGLPTKKGVFWVLRLFGENVKKNKPKKFSNKWWCCIPRIPMVQLQSVKNHPKKSNYSWWFQPSWNTLVKMGIFPQVGVNIKIFETTTWPSLFWGMTSLRASILCLFCLPEGGAIQQMASKTSNWLRT